MSPSKVSTVNASDYPKLDRKQAGHLRHYHNLVSQEDGDWHYFGTPDAHEEIDDAKRYQLATMAYAIGAAHYHHLPALRDTFRVLMRKVIHKMLLREVWSYWFLASHSGKLVDPDLTELRKPWADPVIKENIMYSGHLLMMTSLYAMLFDDNEFEQKDSIVFRWNPIFWGMGDEEFRYDNRSLAKLIGMRYNDVRDGTNTVESEILPKCSAALQKKGMLQANGLYASLANTFMHAWNSQFVQDSYEKQTLGFLTHFDGKTSLQPTGVAQAFRSLVLEGKHDTNDKATLIQARKISVDFKSMLPFETLNWLAFTMMLSELGKKKELDDLLEYADSHLNPTWVNGGLYYPRNSRLMDDDWNLTHIEAHSGNSGIGYARLNVPNGQKTMWEQPWTRGMLASRPWVGGDGLAEGVDFLRGIWDEKKEAMVITVRRWDGEEKIVRLTIENAPAGQWDVVVDGSSRGRRGLGRGGRIELTEVVGHEEVDIVVQRVEEAHR